MKRIWLVSLMVSLLPTGWAQPAANTLAASTAPAVQAGGTFERPGGISYVTRQRSLAGSVKLANSFWAAGGVPVVTANGAAGTGVAVSTLPVVAAAAPTPRPVIDPRALTALRQMAARGNESAKRALAAATAASPSR